MKLEELPLRDRGAFEGNTPLTIGGIFVNISFHNKHCHYDVNSRRQSAGKAAE